MILDLCLIPEVCKPWVGDNVYSFSVRQGHKAAIRVGHTGLSVVGFRVSVCNASILSPKRVRLVNVGASITEFLGAKPTRVLQSDLECNVCLFLVNKIAFRKASL